MFHRILFASILITFLAVYAWDPTYKRYTTRKILYRTNTKPPKLIQCYRYHHLRKAMREAEREIDPIELKIIDIREREEVNETGTIPGGLNIPVPELYTALNMSLDEFRDTYHAEKPRWHRKLVIVSKYGPEGLACCEEVLRYNYTRVGNYHSGWVDWHNRTKITGMSFEFTWNEDAYTLVPLNGSEEEVKD